MTEHRLCAAVIGCGDQAGWQRLHAYRRLQKLVRLGHCYDVNREAAERFAAEFGLTAHSSIPELMRKARPDLVSVTTPPATHADVVEAIMAELPDIRQLAEGEDPAVPEVGLWVEKPSETTRQAHDRLVEAARARGAVLIFGYDKLWSEIQWILELYNLGLLGEIVHIEARWLRANGAPLRGVFLDKQLSGGGPGFDLLSHLLSLVRFLLGEPFVSVRAHTSSKTLAVGGTLGIHAQAFAHATVEDFIHGTAVVRNGTTVDFAAAWDQALMKDEWTFRVIGTTGSAELVLRRVGPSNERLEASALLRPGKAVPDGPRTRNGYVLVRPERRGRSLAECRAALLADLVRGVHTARRGWAPELLANDRVAGDALAALEASYRSAELGHEVAVTA